ncbi:MAG: hypothetical protein HC767_06600 [Akkermansiaceae bacterium]|nr:hypothetical protein [Akkermansiaceae bacterium]
MTTFNQTAVTVGATSAMPPTNSSTPDEIKAWVEHQLDIIGNDPLLNRFVLLGPHERRRGGAHLVVSPADAALPPGPFAVEVHRGTHELMPPCVHMYL